jgi:solute carrier family 25 carnitine/acylcarnitine transporter 20/29
LFGYVHDPIQANLRSYFMAYEYLVQRHMRVNGVKRETISPLWSVTFGAAAGYALWAR